MTVFFEASMSRDGFMAGPNITPENPMGDGGEELHDWMFAGRSDEEMAAFQDAMFESVGALVMGPWPRAWWKRFVLHVAPRLLGGGTPVARRLPSRCSSAEDDLVRFRSEYRRRPYPLPHGLGAYDHERTGVLLLVDTSDRFRDE